MGSKVCDSCKSANATLFCRADSAFLCLNCDTNIHAANKLASRHARVWLCEVCEQAPAHVTCKADAASLCVTCDRDIHAANPLARRHDRVPVVPFYESPAGSTAAAFNFLDDGCFSSAPDGDADVVSREEAEAASWLLPNPKSAVDGMDLNTGQYLFSDMDPYLDLDYGSVDPKVETQDRKSSGSDGVVPGLMNEHLFDLDFIGSKAYSYEYNTHCLSHSVSSSSLEAGLVPDVGVTVDISNHCNGPETAINQMVVALSPADREARVMRYREKRKNRRFEKTIRYASRKAYAEMRPRIKGRFAKRIDSAVETNNLYGFGVVPS